MDLPTDLLDLPAAEGARALALEFLGEANAASRRLTDASDTEALHDFRVGLRRLRSTIRAYREEVQDSLPKRLRRRLRDLAAATGPGRDAEVQIAWLKRHGARLPAAEAAGCDWFRARLEERRDDAYRAVRQEVLADFGRLERSLRKRLSVWEAPVRGASRRPLGFAVATGRKMERAVVELEASLATVHDHSDDGGAHNARLAAKRLRYLLEPLHHLVHGVKPLIESLKGVQDLLGELSDLAVFAREVTDAYVVAAVDAARGRLADALSPPVPEPLGDPPPAARKARSWSPPGDATAGLLALARLLRARKLTLFERLHAEWLQGRSEERIQPVRQLAERLIGA